METSTPLSELCPLEVEALSHNDLKWMTGTFKQQHKHASNYLWHHHILYGKSAFKTSKQKKTFSP